MHDREGALAARARVRVGGRLERRAAPGAAKQRDGVGAQRRHRPTVRIARRGRYRQAMRRRAPSRQFEQTLLGITDQLDELQARIHATAATPEDEAALFQLVVVCTGNRFRSPLAAAVVEQLVADAAGARELARHARPRRRSTAARGGQAGRKDGARPVRTPRADPRRHRPAVCRPDRRLRAGAHRRRRPRGARTAGAGVPPHRARRAARGAAAGVRRRTAATAHGTRSRTPKPCAGRAPPSGTRRSPTRSAARRGWRARSRTTSQRLTISLLRGLFGSEAVAPAARRLPKRRRLF